MLGIITPTVTAEYYDSGYSFWDENNSGQLQCSTCGDLANTAPLLSSIEPVNDDEIHPISVTPRQDLEQPNVHQNCSILVKIKYITVRKYKIEPFKPLCFSFTAQKWHSFRNETEVLNAIKAELKHNNTNNASNLILQRASHDKTARLPDSFSSNSATQPLLPPEIAVEALAAAGPLLATAAQSASAAAINGASSLLATATAWWQQPSGNEGQSPGPNNSGGILPL